MRLHPICARLTPLGSCHARGPVRGLPGKLANWPVCAKLCQVPNWPTWSSYLPPPPPRDGKLSSPSVWLWTSPYQGPWKLPSPAPPFGNCFQTVQRIQRESGQREPDQDSYSGWRVPGQREKKCHFRPNSRQEKPENAFFFHAFAIRSWIKKNVRFFFQLRKCAFNVLSSPPKEQSSHIHRCSCNLGEWVTVLPSEPVHDGCC